MTVNQSQFTVTLKKVAKGTKVKATVLFNGEPIGDRTSARTYRFALVVTRNQEYERDAAKRNAEQRTKEAARYEAVVAGDAKALAESRRQFPHTDEWLRDGSFAQWAKGCREVAAEQMAKFEALTANPNLPEFSKPFVTSWHQRRDLVPDAKPWQKFVAVVAVEPTVEFTINQ